MKVANCIVGQGMIDGCSFVYSLRFHGNSHIVNVGAGARSRLKFQIMSFLA